MSGFTRDFSNLITNIDPESVARLLEHITPLVRVDGKLFEYTPEQGEDHFETSFTWSENLATRRGAEAKLSFTEDSGTEGREDALLGAEEESVAGKLYRLDTIFTYHRTGHHSFFKPSIAEVLAQIPGWELLQVAAFEVLFSDEITECIDLPGFYGHRTQTRLYGKHSNY